MGKTYSVTFERRVVSNAITWWYNATTRLARELRVLNSNPAARKGGRVVFLPVSPEISAPSPHLTFRFVCGIVHL